MIKCDPVYDESTLNKNLMIFGLMVACMYLTQGVGFAIIVVLVLHALILKNNENLLLIIFLIVGAQVGNNKLMPKGAVFYIVQKGLIFFLLLVVVYQSTKGQQTPLLKPFLLIMPYILYMFISSILGWNPIISYLKILLFVSYYFVFLGITNIVILDEKIPIQNIKSIFLSICCFSIFGSIILIPFPSLSLMTGVEYLEAISSGYIPLSYFKGIMFQSQTLGPLTAMIVITLFSDYIMSVKKKNKLYLALIICAPFLIYKSSSRTAMGTLIAGIIFSTYLFIHTKQIDIKWKSTVITSILFFVIILSIILCFSLSWKNGLAKYVLKNQKATTMSEYNVKDIIVSRQDKIINAIENFKKHPLIGNGFQVSEDLSSIKDAGIKSLISAPVEKSVWVTAILEEGGIIGMFLFIIFIVFALNTMIKQKTYICATLLFSMIILNLGEFIIFSMSGAGGYCWALCFMSVILDAQRLKENKK